MLKRFLPRTLLGRSLMILVTPLVLLQLVATYIFYERHWDTVTRRLVNNLVGDISLVVEFTRAYPNPEMTAWMLDRARENLDLGVGFEANAILPNTPPPSGFDLFEETLAEALRERIRRPFQIDTGTHDRQVEIAIQLSDGVLRVLVSRKRLASATTYIFVLWMVGASLILFGVATIFMRNQVRPIRRLAIAADAFGKGRDAPNFKPEGALEVRRAAAAFLDMRERIRRHIDQRTAMLSGVSHDLRTPLTRMKLQLEMMAGDGVDELKEDVAEMETMIDGYLAFIRGEGNEPSAPTDLGGLVEEVIGRARRQNGVTDNGAANNGGNGGIDLHVEEPLTVTLRPRAIQRALTNLVANAARHGSHVAVRVGRRGDAAEITVDDDGPGVPPDQREDVFRPFFRIEGSRNPATGGIGLGLTIARDIARSHGGDIELADSPSGGLRAKVRLPL